MPKFNKKAAIVGVIAASLISSFLLLYYSIDLKNYCLDNTKSTAHWPLAYTELWPSSKLNLAQAIVQDSLPLSTAQYNIVAWMSIASAILFITLLSSNYLLSTSFGETAFCCLIYPFLVAIACTMEKIETGKGAQWDAEPFAKRCKRFFIDLQVASIAVLLTSAATLALANLLVVIPEQKAAGEMIYREHFTIVLKHYSFQMADRAVRGELGHSQNYQSSLSDQWLADVTVRLMAQLQRLQATHECCGLERGVVDFDGGDYQYNVPAAANLVSGHDQGNGVVINPSTAVNGNGNSTANNASATDTTNTTFTPLTTETQQPPPPPPPPPPVHYPEIVPASCCGRLDPKPGPKASSKKVKAYQAREEQWIEWLVENPLANCSRYQVPKERNVGCKDRLTAAYLRPVTSYLITLLPLQLILAALLAVITFGLGLKGRSI